MEIKDATIEDLLIHLDFIRQRIDAKKDICKEEVLSRLDGRDYGIKMATDEGSLAGIYVWYEDEGSLYLWLGACSCPGKGVGSLIVESIQNSTSYERWYVKTGLTNAAALRHLEKHDFSIYKTEGSVAYLEKFF